MARKKSCASPSKKDVIDAIASETKFHPDDVRAIIDGMPEALSKLLAEHEVVALPGLFKIQKTLAKARNNPFDASKLIPAHIVLRCSTSRRFKAAYLKASGQAAEGEDE